MSRGARVASVVVAALLVASLAAAAVTGTEGAAADRLTEFSSAADGVLDDDADPVVTRRLTYDRTPSEPGNVTVAVEFAVGRDAERLVVSGPENATVVERDGFEAETRYDDWAYEWDGDTDSPALTVTVPVNRTSGAFDGLDFADTGDWALLRSTEGFDSAYYSDEAGEWVYSWRDDPRFRSEFEATGPGHVSAGVGFLGEYETDSRTVGDQTATLVVPAAASPEASRNETFAVLAAARDAFRFGGVDDRVTVYVGPDPLRSGGYYQGPSSFWVHQDSLDGAGTLVHEYVHTRQAYRAGDAVAWFDEGSANYYRELLQYERGLQSYESFRTDLADDGGETGTLADRHTWSSADLEYHHGERVAAALDAKLRQETDGERTLQDVLGRLNEHDGEVRYADFRAAVAAVAGTSLDGWLDEYVQSDALPRLPDDPGLYTLPSSAADGDSDGDHAATDEPPEPTGEREAATTGTAAATESTTTAATETPTTGVEGVDSDGASGGESPGFGVLAALAALAVLGLGLRVADRE